jgi:uncharacterized protein (DUF111 family)
MPPMRVERQGFGAGTRELEELPNCTQVVVGVRVERSTGAELPEAPDTAGQIISDVDADAGQPVSHLEANVDDATGEQLAHAVSVLLDAGVHDAWLAPIMMKKGRPGSVVHVLCDPTQVASFRSILRETTGSLGVRVTHGERWPAARSMDSVWVDGQLIRIKVSAGRIKVEHDDVAQAARRTGQPLRELAYRAEALWRSTNSGPRMAAVDPAKRNSNPPLRGIGDRRERAPEPPQDGGSDTA